MSAVQRKDPLALAAIGLAVVAFAGSFTHVQETVAEAGQDGWISFAIASMPEVSVVLAILKIRRARKTGEPVLWAWIVGLSAAAFTLAANLAQADPSPWGLVAAAWPAWASIGAAGLIEIGPSRRATSTRRPAKAPEPATAAAQTVLPTTSSAGDRVLPRGPSGVDDLLLLGQAVAEQLQRDGHRLTRKALVTGVRAHGRTVSNTRAGELLERLRSA